MGELFRQLDTDKTADNTERFLKNFETMLLRAGEGYSLLQSPNIKGMPKPPSFENTADIEIIERLNARYLVVSTVVTIEKLDFKSQQILKALFIDQDKKTITDLSYSLSYSRKKIYQFKQKALVSFAEAFKAENLRVFKPKIEK